MVIVLILIAIGIVSLNFVSNKGKETKEASHKIVERQEQTPLARRYTILYAYTGISVAIISISTYMSLVSIRRSPYPSQQILQIGVVVFALLFVAMMLYLILSKKMKDVTNVLKILLVLNILDVLFGVAKPGPGLLLAILQTSLTFLVFRSLLAGKNSIFSR